MIDKYVVAVVLVISNTLGITAISKIDNTAYQAEPNNLIVFDAPDLVVPKSQVSDDTKPVVVNTKTEQVVNTKTEQRNVEHYGIIFKHGDVSWLPTLAAQAGWPKATWPMLEKIILRESGGCPNRRGGDVVNKNCIITNVSEWNHRSDTGLLQINGVNYNFDRNKWAAVCLQLNICTQEPLLDPLTNLKAGKVLYDLAGWGPWDPCTWGPKYAHKCKSKGKP